MRHSLSLGEIQFYWRMVREPKKEACDIPAFLPFELSFDENLQLFRQVPNPAVVENLEKVYRHDYNVGYLQDGHALAEGYANDFIDFLLRHLIPSTPASILEIGCGGGYLIDKIKETGQYKLYGIDPSPIAAKKFANSEVRLIQSFFPSSDFQEKVDAIIHYDVLEHTLDPVLFLKQQQTNLTDRGIVCFAVPDCTPYIGTGDVSMVLHEHINYFDADSLSRTVQAAGFSDIVVNRSNHGGVLYCYAQVGSKADNKKGVNTAKFVDFCNKFKKTKNKIEQLVYHHHEAGKSLGFYVPLRAMPYISHLRTFPFRFFDDDPGIHGKYFDGFDIPVESLDDMKQKPVDTVVIMSTSFGKQIIARIEAQLQETVSPILLESLLEP